MPETLEIIFHLECISFFRFSTIYGKETGCNSRNPIAIRATMNVFSFEVERRRNRQTKETFFHQLFLLLIVVVNQ